MSIPEADLMIYRITERGLDGHLVDYDLAADCLEDALRLARELCEESLKMREVVGIRELQHNETRQYRNEH